MSRDITLDDLKELIYQLIKHVMERGYKVAPVLCPQCGVHTDYTVKSYMICNHKFTPTGEIVTPHNCDIEYVQEITCNRCGNNSVFDITVHGDGERHIRSIATLRAFEIYGGCEDKVGGIVNHITNFMREKQK